MRYSNCDLCHLKGFSIWSGPSYSPLSFQYTHTLLLQYAVFGEEKRGKNEKRK